MFSKVENKYVFIYQVHMMTILHAFVGLFLAFILYFCDITKPMKHNNRSSIEQFKDPPVIGKKKSNSTNEKIMARLETLEGEFKELSVLMGYTLESIDNRVKKNEQKLKTLSLRQRDTQAEVKEISEK